MKLKFGKVSLLFLALVLALAGVGAAFAAWTDTITISGTVETGKLCAQFGSVGILDPYAPVNPGGDFPPYPHPPDWTCNDGFVPRNDGSRFWQLDKNVAWGELERVADANGKYKTLKVTLHNAYPSYFNEVRFYPENCGTLPWRIDHAVVSRVSNGTPMSEKIYSHGTVVKMDVTGDGKNDLEIMYGDNFGAQVHPGGFPPEISFWIHVLQPAPQNSTLEFTIELVVVQWNKYPLPRDE